MQLKPRDVVLGVTAALWFPVALTVTDLACSQPGDVGSPPPSPAHGALR